MTIDIFGNIQVPETMDIHRLPYMGSKNKIALQLFKKMLEIKPNAKYFVDLFGGGGSMSFTALQLGFKVIYNEKNKNLVDLIKFVVGRIQRGEKSKYGILPEHFYEFITREKFNELKDKEGVYAEFARVCYSFGNKGTAYLYGKDIEEYKHTLHNVVIYQHKEAGDKFLAMIGKEDDARNFNDIYKLDTWGKRRLFIRTYIMQNTRNTQFGKHNNTYLYCTKDEYEYIKDLSIVERARWLNKNKLELADDKIKLERLERLQQLEQLERLQQLQRLEQLEQLPNIPDIQFLNLDYKDVVINTPCEQTIIYLDPPYRNTAKYKVDTFYEEIDEYFAKSPYMCFMSEYNAPFEEVMQIDKIALLKSTTEQRAIKQEKLYINQKKKKA